MILLASSPNLDGTRRWRGRLGNYVIFISEVMNIEAGHVDKYSYHITSRLGALDYNSIDENRTFNTVESCKNAALAHIDAYRAKISIELQEIAKKQNNR